MTPWPSFFLLFLLFFLLFFWLESLLFSVAPGWGCRAANATCGILLFAYFFFPILLSFLPADQFHQQPTHNVAGAASGLMHCFPFF